MANNVKNPDALNKLLKEILLNVFDQAHGEFEERTGRAVKMSRLQTMKYNGAAKLVAMAMKPLERFGNAEQKFERFVKITNEHLPAVVEMVGEDAIVTRLRRVPSHVLNAEAVKDLHDAGAHEIAALLGKVLPESARPVVAVAAPVAAAVAVAAPVVVPAPVSVTPADGTSLEALRQQLSLMKTFEAQVRESIADLETAIAAEERKGVKPRAPQP